MDWQEKLYRYCERGADPAFWAEPLNALTNSAFLIAGLLAVSLYRRQKFETTDIATVLLIALVFVIATGSFLFHVMATRWAAYADLIPIGIFMLAYFGYALRRFAGCSMLVTGLAIVGFIVALYIAANVSCAPSFTPVTTALGLPCLNGTAGYIPAFSALIGIGIWLWVKSHPAWLHLIFAGLVFYVSMICRAADFEICNAFVVNGHRLGSHFVWHILNAVVLYSLVKAAILYGSECKRTEKCGTK
jgi:Ceramidase